MKKSGPSGPSGDNLYHQKMIREGFPPNWDSERIRQWWLAWRFEPTQDAIAYRLGITTRWVQELGRRLSLKRPWKGKGPKRT